MEETTEQPAVSELVSEVIPEKNSNQPPKKTFLLLLVLTLCVVVGGATLYIVNQQSKSLTSLPQGQPQEDLESAPASSATPFPSSSVNGDGMFLRSGSVVRVNTQNQTVSYGSGRVNGFSYHAATQQLATIEGEPIINSAGYPFIEPNIVVVYQLKDGTKETIFEIPIKKIPQSDYAVILRSVGFSHDGKTLAITSSDSIWIYDVQAKNPTVVYSKPLTQEQLTQGHIEVWGYGNPRFSPDKQNLLVAVLQYEGAQAALLNLNTKQLSVLPFQVGNGGGMLAIDWISPTELIVLDSKFDSDSTFKQVRISDLSEMTLASFTGNLHSPVLDGTSVYFIRQTLAPFNSIEVTEPGIEEIVKLDLTTRQSTVLLTRQRVEEKNWQELYMNSSSLYLREYSHTKIGEQFKQSSTIYFLNQRTPNVTLEPVDTGTER